jgi:hypothetical protein
MVEAGALLEDAGQGMSMTMVCEAEVTAMVTEEKQSRDHNGAICGGLACRFMRQQ